MEVADSSGEGEVDFDEFYLLMAHCRKTEGFTKAEIQRYQDAFDENDGDGSGELGTLELGYFMRMLGYPTNVNMLQECVEDVDVDGSGELDFSEILKLMRKYRNNELQLNERIFNLLSDEGDEEEKLPRALPATQLVKVIEMLGY